MTNRPFSSSYVFGACRCSLLEPESKQTSPLCTGEFGSLIKKTFSPSSPFECNLELIQITGAVGELSKRSPSKIAKCRYYCLPTSKANQVHWVVTSLILMMYDFVLNCACGGKQSAAIQYSFTSIENYNSIASELISHTIFATWLQIISHCLFNPAAKKIKCQKMLHYAALQSEKLQYLFC